MYCYSLCFGTNVATSSVCVYVVDFYVGVYRGNIMLLCDTVTVAQRSTRAGCDMQPMSVSSVSRFASRTPPGPTSFDSIYASSNFHRTGRVRIMSHVVRTSSLAVADSKVMARSE